MTENEPEVEGALIRGFAHHLMVPAPKDVNALMGPQIKEVCCVCGTWDISMEKRPHLKERCKARFHRESVDGNCNSPSVWNELDVLYEKYYGLPLPEDKFRTCQTTTKR